MRRAERGSAVVEFALVLPLVLMVLLASVEVLAAARTQLVLVVAAREGAREAATTPDPSRAVDATRDALGPALAGRARVSVRRPAVVGERATVTVRYRHTFLAPFFGGVGVDLSARAVMRVER